MKKFSLLLAIAALAIGCQPENIENTPAEKPIEPEGHTTLSISLDATTRTSLSERDNNGVYPTYWCEGDEIAVNGVASEEIKIDTENKALATFEIAQSLSYPYHITYPYCKSTTAEKALIEFPTYREHSKEFHAPMCGYVESAEEQISLHHLSTVLHFPMKASENDVVLSKVHIISTSGAKLSGTFEVDCQNATISPTNSCKANITYTLPKNFKLTTTMVADIFIVLPAVEVGSCKITFEDESGNNMKTIWTPTTPLAKGTVREFAPISYVESTSNKELSLDEYEKEGVIPYQKYAKSDEIKIMSFNVRTTLTESSNPNYGWEYRKEACVALIKDHMPSIIGVQEAKYNAHWTYLREELAADYTGYGVNRDTGKESGSGETMGILYNKSIIAKIDGGTFWLSETPDTPSKGFGANYSRNATWGLFRHKPSGVKFYYINTHIDHQSKTAQVEGMKLISAFFEQYKDEYPLFITADFNMTSDNEAFDPIEAYMYNTREVAPAMLTDYNTTFNGYVTTKNSIIDHIYCSNYLKVLEYHTINEDYGAPFVSDHYPVYAIIKLK